MNDNVVKEPICDGSALFQSFMTYADAKIHLPHAVARAAPLVLNFNELTSAVNKSALALNDLNRGVQLMPYRDTTTGPRSIRTRKY